MNLLCEVQVTITGFNEQHFDAIWEQVDQLLLQDDDRSFLVNKDEETGTIVAEHDFASEESMQEWVSNLTHAIWATNQAYCEVDVEAKMIYPPRWVWTPDENSPTHYDKWLQQTA